MLFGRLSVRFSNTNIAILTGPFRGISQFLPTITGTVLRLGPSMSCAGVCDYRRGVDWWIDLLTTYTHHSELPVITALSLISTLYKSPQHPLSLSLACCVFISHSMATASDNGDSSASRSQVVSSQSPVQKSTLNWQPTTNLVAPFDFKITLPRTT
jgi:hypothetical protein